MEEIGARSALTTSRTGVDHLHGGNALMAQARLDLLAGAKETAEQKARQAISSYWSAMNWLEDSVDFEAAHAKLHDAGRWTMETFGCGYAKVDHGYEQKCPVSLAHLRFVFSPEMIVGLVLCSTCGEDATACPHIAGREYPVECMKAPQCNVCHRQACEHVEGQTYPANCYRIVTEIKRAEGIAIVARPATPDARILGRPRDPDYVRSTQPPGWQRGGPARCVECRGLCEGFQEMPAGH